jgi:hypothetical protein
MNDAAVVVLEERALDDLLEGIDVEHASRRRSRARPSRTH